MHVIKSINTSGLKILTLPNDIHYITLHKSRQNRDIFTPKMQFLINSNVM